MLLVTLSLAISSEEKRKGLAGLVHRIKRSSGNCIESSTYRDDIFPRMANLTCKPGCQSIEYEIQYAVIKIEKFVVGCRKEKELPNSEIQVSFETGDVSRVCKKGFKAKKINISRLHETAADRLEVKSEEIIYDCVKDNN